MPRPITVEPRSQVKPVPDKKPTRYAWTVFYSSNGVPQRKQGKISIARVAKEQGLSPAQAKHKAAEMADDEARAFKELLKTLSPHSNWTVESWCRYCCKHVIAKEASIEYATAALNNLELHVFGQLGKVPLKKLTTEQVEAWHQWRVSTPSKVPISNGNGEVIGYKKPKTLGWKTIDLILGYLGRCLGVAEQRKYGTNHVRLMAKDKKAKESYKAKLADTKQWLPVEDIKVLVKASEGAELYGVLLIQRDSGSRIGEACGVRIEHFDVGLGSFKIEKQLRWQTKEFGGVRVLDEKDPKGDGARLAFASDELLAFVKQRAAEEALKPESDRCPYVVMNSCGGPLDPSAAGKLFRKLAEKHGVELRPGNGTHATRRRVLNLVKGAPISAETKAKMAGHDDYSTSQAKYHSDELDEAEIQEIALAARHVQNAFGA